MEPRRRVIRDSFLTKVRGATDGEMWIGGEEVGGWSDAECGEGGKLGGMNY